MKSKHADTFNHDGQADRYDADVADESNPIRAGYEAVLNWTAAQVPPSARVVADLGCGTGNLTMKLTERLGAQMQIHCVDISERMLNVARTKLNPNPCTFINADLLACFDRLPNVDAIVSTYAVHHLTADEKLSFFERCVACLAPGGTLVCGDLMFENAMSRSNLLATFVNDGRQSLVDDINDEFFWDVDETTQAFASLGLDSHAQRFSTLSWGIVAQRR